MNRETALGYVEAQNIIPVLATSVAARISYGLIRSYKDQVLKGSLVHELTFDLCNDVYYRVSLVHRMYFKIT